MKHEIQTKDHAGRVLEFTWDDETGEIAGDESGDLESAIKAAEASGKVEWPSWDQWVEVTDPRRNKRDMALVLAAMGFGVPDSFSAVFPTFDNGHHQEGNRSDELN